jgi:hypothetical protein
MIDPELFVSGFMTLPREPNFEYNKDELVKLVGRMFKSNEHVLYTDEKIILDKRHQSRIRTICMKRRINRDKKI